MNNNEIKVIHANKIYEMLALIEKRPLLFLTLKTITAFQNFLNGYFLTNYKHEDLYNPNEPIFDNFIF